MGRKIDQVLFKDFEVVIVQDKLIIEGGWLKMKIISSKLKETYSPYWKLIRNSACNLITFQLQGNTILIVD